MDYRRSVSSTDFKFDAIPVILVVEDDEDNQFLLKNTIAMFGWKSIIVSDAISSIYLAKNEQPDLILLDIVLPHINGLQIATILKSHDRTRHIPLIAVTGLAREKEKNSIFAVGFDNYVCKPYMLESLHQTIVSSLKIAQTNE